MNPGSTLLLLLNAPRVLPAPPTIVGIPRYGPATYDGPMGASAVVPTGNSTLLGAILAYWNANGLGTAIGKLSTGRDPSPIYPYVVMNKIAGGPQRRNSTDGYIEDEIIQISIFTNLGTADAEARSTLIKAYYDPRKSRPKFTWTTGREMDCRRMVDVPTLEANPGSGSASMVWKNVVQYRFETAKTMET